MKFLHVTVALSIIMAVQCGGDGKKAAELKPTLSSIQHNIFDKRCAISGCHTGNMPESQLNLSSGKSYRNLVDVHSRQIQDMLLVDPGHPEQSYLLAKIQGGKIVGEQMPTGRKSLSDKEIETIREWIQSGAPE